MSLTSPLHLALFREHCHQMVVVSTDLMVRFLNKAINIRASDQEFCSSYNSIAPLRKAAQSKGNEARKKAGLITSGKLQSLCTSFVKGHIAWSRQLLSP
jgi:hypothetical protein